MSENIEKEIYETIFKMKQAMYIYNEYLGIEEDISKSTYILDE